MLSAQDVHDKQFKLVRQSTGYDIDEVDAFLDEVEGVIAALSAELESARAAAGVTGSGAAGAHDAPAPSTAAADGAEPPASAARILELAQRTADQYLAEATRAADSLRAQAEQSARAAVADLEGQRADLEARVAALRTFEAQVRARLTDYFTGQLRDLRSLGSPPEPGPSA